MSDSPILPGPLWEFVAAALRERILTGELTAGTKLVETELAEQFGTSRGPIREAIRELAREGLVAELARRATFVSTLTGHDLGEVYGVREALEQGACKATIARASDAELAALEQHLVAFEASWVQGGGYLESAVHDLAFHRAIVALSGNRRMVAIHDQMLAQTMLLLRGAAAESPQLHEQMPKAVHRDILDALLDRDEARVAATLDAHYRTAEQRLFDRSPVSGARG